MRFKADVHPTTEGAVPGAFRHLQQLCLVQTYAKRGGRQCLATQSPPDGTWLAPGTEETTLEKNLSLTSVREAFAMNLELDAVLQQSWPHLLEFQQRGPNGSGTTRRAESEQEENI